MIETKVTDDAIPGSTGSLSAEEREWFRLLQTVQNVGARVALNVLSALSPRELERALALSDKAAIGRAQGVGPKLALRFVTELKDKAPSMMLRGHGEEGGHRAGRGAAREAGNGPRRRRRPRQARLFARPGRRSHRPRRPRSGRTRAPRRPDPRKLAGDGAVGVISD